ncbi:nickel pincer cofactor biosynthesis protein LarB [Desulfoplanes formicivorans]|uniref:1-(5-phosphoribosyl)-5-amino-4-imidazole-carboxylate carboxylase n=1 Tax=Desulfoplanes formicivorans TaxID=1592317 RepID=A0A194AGP4_9BACT|nr:nickel pincer cofactor biosynthesis protein LarB [Desulfoplanes formicivorans]GAU08498.1 1-(5-phosphoribosyl)-5-amino-4-imidazole-carboxylate carboxylase [Desulfoplanes formicivorans]
MNDQQELRELLQQIRDGRMNVEQGMQVLRNQMVQDLGHTKIDLHRELRNGFPEVIYAEGKTPRQVGEIFGHMRAHGNVLATRVTSKTAEHVLSLFPDACYDPLGRTLTHVHEEPSPGRGKTVIVTAGTSDLGVAHEARTTCRMLGIPATIVSDVGVAGIHRLFDQMEHLRQATVLIVIAGMEGALASVIGGLVDKPIIAVPTSVGYGAHFAGLAALLGMLASCASGISVVNIDNGFGAACAACRITRLLGQKDHAD